MDYEVSEFNSYSVYEFTNLVFRSGDIKEFFGEIFLEAETADEAIEEARTNYNLSEKFCIVEKECTEIDNEVFVDQINLVCGSKEIFEYALNHSAWPLSDSPMANLTFYNMLKRGEQTIYKAPVYAVYPNFGISSDGPELYLDKEMAESRLKEHSFLIIETLNKEEE